MRRFKPQNNEIKLGYYEIDFEEGTTVINVKKVSKFTVNYGSKLWLMDIVIYSHWGEANIYRRMSKKNFNRYTKRYICDASKSNMT